MLVVLGTGLLSSSPRKGKDSHCTGDRGRRSVAGLLVPRWFVCRLLFGFCAGKAAARARKECKESNLQLLAAGSEEKRRECGPPSSVEGGRAPPGRRVEEGKLNSSRCPFSTRRASGFGGCPCRPRPGPAARSKLRRLKATNNSANVIVPSSLAKDLLHHSAHRQVCALKDLRPEHSSMESESY